MNYDDVYEIRLATRKDIPDLMKFLHNHWKENHILSKDRTLFEYEFCYKEQVNFIVAIRKENQSIESIFGYLNCSHPERNTLNDVWGSFWKVVENNGNLPFLGLELAKRFYKLTSYRMHIGNGANPQTTIPFRKKFFKEYTGKMDHYYLLNPSIEKFKIAKVNQQYLPEVEKKLSNSNYILRPLLTIQDVTRCFNFENYSNLKPFKDAWYFEKRYFNHPYYEYDVYAVEHNQLVYALLVVRIVEVHGRKVIRIVDYWGETNSFQYLYFEFSKWFQDETVEYIDFYVSGMHEEVITAAGFIKRTEVDSNIIPNYFEPFMQSNVDIWTHSPVEDTLFFKADGDQDRPNFERRN